MILTQILHLVENNSPNGLLRMLEKKGTKRPVRIISKSTSNKEQIHS